MNTPRGTLWRMLTTVGMMSGLCVAAALAVAAQESRSLRAERSFDFQTGKTFDLQTQIGQVKIVSVEFTDMGRGFGQGGLASRVRGTDSEASTTIRTHFLVDNPTSDKWEVAFTLEFVDKGGKLVDRVTKKSKWDHETKPFDIDHQLLEYVVPLIGQVRIKLEGQRG